MDALTRVGCRLILNEVFECDEPNALLERGDAFFGTLPEPSVRVPLAKTSPLNSADLDAEDTEPPVAPGAPVNWSR
jgi:hypothetical protein